MTDAMNTKFLGLYGYFISLFNKFPPLFSLHGAISIPLFSNFFVSYSLNFTFYKLSYAMLCAISFVLDLLFDFLREFQSTNCLTKHMMLVTCGWKRYGNLRYYFSFYATKVYCLRIN